jgi:hypothetical protein
MKKTISIILIIVSVSMISIGFYLNSESPKMLMIKTLSTQLKNSNIKSDGDYKSQVSTKLLFNYNKKVDVSEEKKLNISGKELKLYSEYFVDVLSNISDKISEYYSESKIYIQVNKVLNKIKEINNIKTSNNLSDEDMNNYVNIVLKTSVDELQYNKFSSENCKIKIDKSIITVKKYSAQIDYNDMIKIYNQILNNIKKDSKLKKVYNDISKNEIIKKLEKNKYSFEYSIYVLEDNSILMHEIINKTQNENHFDKIVLSKYLDKNIEYYNFIVSKNDSNVLDVEINGTNKNYDILVISNEMDFVLNGNLETKNDNSVLQANIFNLKNKKELIGSISYENTILNPDNESKVIIDIISSYNGNNMNFHSENIINTK